MRIWYLQFRFCWRYSLFLTCWLDGGNRPVLKKLSHKLALHIFTLVKNTIGLAITVALVSCSQTDNSLVAYDCEGSGVLISDNELRWNTMTFHFQEDTGVFRIYSETLSEVQFNRALGTLLWRNSRTGKTILSLSCIRT